MELFPFITRKLFNLNKVKSHRSVEECDLNCDEVGSGMPAVGKKRFTIEAKSAFKYTHKQSNYTVG